MRAYAAERHTFFRLNAWFTTRAAAVMNTFLIDCFTLLVCLFFLLIRFTQEVLFNHAGRAVAGTLAFIKYGLGVGFGAGLSIHVKTYAAGLSIRI